jgi:hypothetical protein
MGLSCAKLREAAFSNHRRRPAPAPQPTLDPRTSQNSESRIEVLRALSFEEGFALGIKVRKLSQLDTDESPKVDPTPDPQWCRISQG